MTKLYASLGRDKRLTDIIFAGSHDAGITEGGSNAQTQNLDVLGQALAGVRLFDLRIMASSNGCSNGSARLMAYHAGGGVKKQTVQRVMEATGRHETLVISELSVGTFGMGLAKILRDAKAFVSRYGSEFLILKFDKCTNWKLIADYCTEILGDRIYQGTGDLNRKTLRDLQGRVIILFSDSGVRSVRATHPLGGGILGWRNLFAKKSEPKSYDARYNGLQYFGKGGTSVNPLKMKWNYGGKIHENIKKQGRLMYLGANNPSAYGVDVLGMMYWTSTGLIENIQSRNDKMWSEKGKDQLRSLWEGGLRESIASRAANERLDVNFYSTGAQLKAFMPNIVMIDFADAEKCSTIYDLNAVAGAMLTQMFRSESEELGDDYKPYLS